MRIFGWLLAAAVLMAFVGGCTSSSSPSAAKRPAPLVVGMNADYPPLTFKDTDGNLQGIEVDFARALGKALGREVRIEVLQWAQLKEALQKHVIDIVMSGVSVTKSRETYALFSEPYLQVSQMAVMKEGAALPNTYNRGKGMKIGYQRYTTSEALVQRVFPDSEHFPASSMRNGMVALLTGQTEYLFADSPAVWYYTATGSLKGLVGWYVPYTQENLAWAMAPENVKLKAEVDAVLEQWRTDGFLGATLNRWIPVKVMTPKGDKPIRFD